MENKMSVIVSTPSVTSIIFPINSVKNPCQDSFNKRSRNCSSEMKERPRKIRRKDDSCNHSEIEEIITSDVRRRKISPQDFVLECIKSAITPSLDLKCFFIEHTDDEIEAYDQTVVTAVRSRDIDKLRNLHQHGHTLQCSNQFGESLIHMACRRGFVDVAKFLIQEAGVSVKVRDDFGRTPMHDACWAPEPSLDLMELLIRICPEMLLLSDKRGHSPLQYVRREHWEIWISFLEKNKQILSTIPERLKTPQNSST